MDSHAYHNVIIFLIDMGNIVYEKMKINVYYEEKVFFFISAWSSTHYFN
jgi:hypothetical protein